MSMRSSSPRRTMATPPKSATQTLSVTVTNVIDNGILAVEQPAGTSLASSGTANFGSITIGQTNELTFTLSSQGEAALLMPSGAVIAWCRCLGLQPGQQLACHSPASDGSTTLTVRFSPATSGNRLATLSIPTNDTRPGRSPYTISLSGIRFGDADHRHLQQRGEPGPRRLGEWRKFHDRLGRRYESLATTGLRRKAPTRSWTPIRAVNS
jgi:hypothetical protein